MREGHAAGRAAKAAALDASARGGVVVGVIGAASAASAASSSEQAAERPAAIDALVPPGWLLATLTSSSLPPITRALAHKALSRATAALTDAYGQEVGDAGLPVLLDERHARHIVGGVVVVAALLEAIGPSRITASALSLPGAFVDEGARVDGVWVHEAAPSSWAAALTAGLPGLVADDDGGRADIAGLALLAALPHRHGPRGFAVHAGQGQGSCAVDRGPPALVRAQWGPPPPVPTHVARSRRDTAWQIHATLAAGGDMVALDEALRGRGAVAVLAPTLSPRQVGVSVVVSEADLDGACRALWQAGAGELACTPVERRAAEVQQVTVLVGRGKTKAPVAVSAWLDGGDVLRVDVEPTSLRAAVRTLDAPADAVHAFAVAEFDRLRRAQNPRADHRIDSAVDSPGATDPKDPKDRNDALE